MPSLDPPQFRIEEVVLGSAAMVMRCGELDIQGKSRVAAGFDQALKRNPAALAADLRGLSFMDSTGVHALIDAEARCRTQGSRFFVIRAGAAVDRVVAALGLDRVFNIISGPEQMLRHAGTLAVTA